MSARRLSWIPVLKAFSRSFPFALENNTIVRSSRLFAEFCHDFLAGNYKTVRESRNYQALANAFWTSNSRFETRLDDVDDLVVIDERMMSASEGGLDGNPEIFGEGPGWVEPYTSGTKAGFVGHGTQFVERVLVAGFGPDGFASR